MAPRASAFQYGAPRPVKAGTNITPPASGTLSASACTSLLALIALQAVAQPLHDRAADEDAAFERELRPSAPVCAALVAIRPLRRGLRSARRCASA